MRQKGTRSTLSIGFHLVKAYKGRTCCGFRSHLGSSENSTDDQLLGPIDRNRIVDDVAADTLLDDGVAPFNNISSNPYMLVLERRGSGKSALLTEIRLRLIADRSMQPPDHLPAEGEPYIIPVMSWE